MHFDGSSYLVAQGFAGIPSKKVKLMQRPKHTHISNKRSIFKKISRKYLLWKMTGLDFFALVVELILFFNCVEVTDHYNAFSLVSRPVSPLGPAGP